MSTVIATSQTIAPQVVAQLRQAIVELQLRPGEALSEKEIALRYGVSRQPVREAFIKLAEQGLLQVLPSRGTYVVKISVRDVLNARFVRESIESAVVRAAARLATDGDCTALDRNVAAQREAIDDGDITRFYQLDGEFHQLIGRIADCPQALRVVEQSRAQIDRVRYLSLPDATPVETLVTQHAAIAAGIRARDPDAAEAAMRVHLREILSALPKLKARHPDLFDASEPPRHAGDMP